MKHYLHVRSEWLFSIYALPFHMVVKFLAATSLTFKASFVCFVSQFQFLFVYAL